MKKLFYALVLLILIFLVFVAGRKIGSSGDFSISSKNKVAVLKIEDVIIDSSPYLESLNQIKKDKNIKALVVRINSPGGAVGPSQEIYSEILKIRSQMPVVASMEAVAASGGYYIACSAQVIYANPGTITGSIGVIAQFVNYKELLNWAKLDVEVIKSGKFKDIGSPLREMTPEEKRYLQQLINNVYLQFKNTVASTRNLKKDELDNIADGRIFSGQQAKELGLVDEIGTLNDAISKASKLAGIEEEPTIVWFPKQKSIIQQLLNASSELTNKALHLPPNKSFGLFYIVDIIH